MSLPSTNELKDIIVDILSSARDDGQLSQLTVRIVRQRLATHFHLGEDVLNSGDYKSFIKATVHATMSSLGGASDEDAELPRREAEGKKEKEKARSAAKTGSRKPRAKAQVHSSGEEAGNGAPSHKKARSKPPKPAKPSDTSKKPESEMKYKSKAIIESSDDEATPESGVRQSPSSPEEKASARSSPPKHNQVDGCDSDIDMDCAAASSPSTTNSKLKRVTESPKTSGRELTRDPMEYELSLVIDEPPKKRQKKQEKSTRPESTRPQKDEKAKRGKKKEALSKDEETINKLKGIVVACGVRKVWKKEFEGLDWPSQQIKRLHLILGDLGMTPRYSIEKAKSLREQRELAQELKDVQEFDKATKRRDKTRVRSSSGTEDPAAQGGDVDVPTRRKPNARASIMAFLQDQSDDE